MYENKRQKLAPVEIYHNRIWKSVFISTAVLITFLFAGTLGYFYTIPGFGWYNSFLNASMILSGMGPMIDTTIYPLSKTAKVFASLYAIISGVTFLSIFGLLIAPIVHRFFHKLHLEDPNDK